MSDVARRSGLVLGDPSGWGTEPIEEALAAHPPRLSGLRPPAGDD